MSTLVAGLLLLGAVLLAAALVVYLTTPIDERAALFTPAQPVGGDGREYAEQYSRRERVRLLITGLGIAIPAWLLLHFAALPALRRFAKVAPCRHWLGIDGSAWLLYGVFAGMPLLCVAMIGLPLARSGLAILRHGQAPPPGQKVLRPTPIRRGRSARLIGLAQLLVLPLLIGLTVYGAVAAHAVLADRASRHDTRHSCLAAAPAAAGEHPARTPTTTRARRKMH